MLQLDNRKDLTKTDWFMWTGAFGDPAYFSQVVDFVFEQLGADNTDKPLTDLYTTSTAQVGAAAANTKIVLSLAHDVCFAAFPCGSTECRLLQPDQGGFRDRAVVGAFWAKLLIEGVKPTVV